MTTEDRWITLNPNTARLPERLLRAHARGEVLFITGAGTSLPSRLPDFKGLVLEVYADLDSPLHSCVSDPRTTVDYLTVQAPPLSHTQSAEAIRFLRNDYDVALGMLERRIDGDTGTSSRVRTRICEAVRTVSDTHGNRVPPIPSQIHKSLIRLAERGATTTIVTTNFDRLLQAAAPRSKSRIKTHALGAIPRPTRGQSFSGVLHIHGVLSIKAEDASDVVVTEQDFGEVYLRRRLVPDFIYDAARLFHLVLVGYSANDAPMRYLLNAVAADGSRFSDLKERFSFVGVPSPTNEVLLEDWKGRGITPIPYNEADNHLQLSQTLHRWAELSPINGDPRKVDAIVRRIVRAPWSATPEESRDLIAHIFRRSAFNERIRLTALMSAAGAEGKWLSAISEVTSHEVATV